jgi:hypothetical protein
MPRFHAASNKRGVVHLTPMTVGQGLLFLRSPRNILYRRQVHAGQLHGDRKPLQRQGMTTFTQLTSAPSHPAEPFTDQLRLAVAAYWPASRAPLVSTPNRICAATCPGARSAARTR